MKNLILILLTFTLFASCGDLTGESTGAKGLLSGYIAPVIGGVEGIEVGQDKYLLAGVANNGGNSSHGFELNFNLNENESITFYFFASSTLSNGINVTFKRDSDSTFMQIQKGEHVHEYELESLAGLDEYHLDLDIHNDHTDVHILLWDHNGAHEDSDECTFDGGCLYNTEDFALDFWLGVGRAPGTFWGFKGSKSKIIKLKGPGRALSNA